MADKRRRQKKPQEPVVIFGPQYGNLRSREFWVAINATNNRTLYDFAVALQDVEARVLRVLNDHIQRAHDEDR